jgi:hypothetical protein
MCARGVDLERGVKGGYLGRINGDFHSPIYSLHYFLEGLE